MKLTSSFVLVLVFALAALGRSTSATTLTFTPTDDAMIFASSSLVDNGNASGRGPGMFAGADGGGGIKRSLVKFNLTSIPRKATVTAVELDLVTGQIAGSGGQGPGCGTSCNPAVRTFNIYQLDYTRSWSEGLTGSTACNGFRAPCAGIGGTGQGWNYTSSCSGNGVDAGCGNDVTWRYIDFNIGSGNQWSNAPNDQDYGTGTFGSPRFGNHNTAGAWTFTNFLVNQTMIFAGDASNRPAFTAMVQDWVTNPAHNNGLEIRGPALESTGTSFIGWWTKDGAAANSNSALSPVLKVTFAVPPR